MTPPGDAGRRDYLAAVAADEAAGRTCIHGQPAGDLVRPWTDTPACPLCRRRHHVHWRRLPARRNPIPAQRTLFG